MGIAGKLIVKNAIWLVTSRLAIGVLTVTTLSVLGRVLGVEQFGVLMLAVTTAEVFSTVTDFGLSYLTVREVARGTTIAGIFSAGLVTKLLLSAALGLVATGIIDTFYTPAVAHVLYLGLLFGIINSLNLFLLAIFNGVQRMGVSSTLLSGQTILVAGLSLFALFLGYNQAMDIMVLRCVGVGFSSFVVFLILRAQTTVRWLAPSGSEVRGLLKTLVPFGLFFVGAIVYFQSDTYQVSAFLGEVAVGRYQAAMKLVVTIEIIPLMVANALYPALAIWYSTSTEKTREMVERTTKYLVIIGISIGLTVFAFADQIVDLLYSSEFQQSAYVLRILALLIPLRFSGHVVGIAITVADAQSSRMAATLSAAVLSLLLNFLVIPRFGIEGAAVVSIVTSLTTVFLYHVIVRKMMDVRPFSAIYGKAGVAFLIAVACQYLLNNVSTVLGFTLSVFLFVATLLLAGGLNKNDVAFVRSNL